MSIPSSSSMDLALLWTQGDWVTRTTALILRWSRAPAPTMPA